MPPVTATASKKPVGVTKQPIFDWKDLFTTIEAAKQCRLHPKTLQNWRARGKGPPHLKFGGRVFYHRSALAEWIASSEHGRRRSVRA